LAIGPFNHHTEHLGTDRRVACLLWRGYGFVLNITGNNGVNDMNTNSNTIKEMETKIRWYTDHKGKPTIDEEWAAHNFGTGAFYAGHGIGLHELSQDWPEVYANKDCMRGYRKGSAELFNIGEVLSVEMESFNGYIMDQINLGATNTSIIETIENLFTDLETADLNDVVCAYFNRMPNNGIKVSIAQWLLARGYVPQMRPGGGRG
jgi:hypothetical protein